MYCDIAVTFMSATILTASLLKSCPIGINNQYFILRSTQDIHTTNYDKMVHHTKVHRTTLF